ncbi:MAG: hypothetical protein HFG54_09205 [Lachnospiraceae bacterium]|jgi:tetratricopeptide (TPR) repeat protein|nr:hypothetical protein [Lachnospiraceae bacterium]
MLDLFQKKKDSKENLEKCLAKKDWNGLARAYYDLGVAAMDKGDLNCAVLWLNRADSIYSASDSVYEKASKNSFFQKEIVSDCSDRIGTLEDAALLYNDIPSEMEEKAEKLDDSQIRIWGLLSIARLVKLGERLSELPGCEVFAALGWAVDLMLKSFQTPITQNEYGQLMNLCNDLYALGDSETFYAGGEIDVPGSAPFQVFDLNGMMGVHQELSNYLDNHLRLLSALSQNQPLPAAEVSMVGCTLLPDYYVRTGAGKLEDVPQIQAERKRIEDDYDFVCSGITWEQVADQINKYKALDILLQDK